MRAILAVALLALFSAQAQALSEYGFLLNPLETSASYYALYPKSCAAFISANNALPDNAREDFAFQKASKAIADFKKAKSAALLQPTFVTTASLPLYRLYSIQCFHYALQALKEAGETAQEGLDVLDGDSAKLGKMVGGNYEGFAGGVMQELNEASEKIKARDGRGESFGSFFVNTVKLENDTRSSAGVARAFAALIGKDSVLKREIGLDDKLSKAMQSLESEWAGKQNERDLVLQEVKLLKSGFQNEKTAAVGENAFYLIGEAQSITGGEELNSFEADFAKAVELEKTSEEKTLQAKAQWKERDYGFASGAIEKLSSSLELLKQEETILREATARSEALEAKLRQRFLAEREKTNALADSSQNPLAAFESRRMLEMQLEQSAGLNTRGERIAFYLKGINELLETEESLSETPAEQSEREKTQLKESGLEEFLQKALKDANVESEKEEFTQLKQAIAGARPQDIQNLYRRLAELHDRALAKLYAQYSGLEEEYAKASALQQVFGDRERQQFSEITQRFDGFGKIGLEENAGTLKETQTILRKFLAYAQAQAPALLEKHLVEGAKIKRTAEPVVAGEKTRVHYRIEMKNLLPVSYGQRIELGFSIPDGAVAASKSPEVEISKGVFIQGVREEGEYYFEYYAFEEIASVQGTSLKAVYADENSAEVEGKTVVYSAEDTDVILKSDYAFPMDSLQADLPGKTVFFSEENSSQARFLFHARQGINEIAFTASVPNAVELKRTIESMGNKSVLTFSLQSKHFNVQEFSAQAIESTCAGAQETPRVEGNLMVQATMLEDALLLGFSERDLKRGEKKTARIILDCVENKTLEENPYDIVKRLDAEEAKKLLDEIEALESQCGNCAFEAKKQVLLGDLKQARAELENAKQAALKEQEKDLAETQNFDQERERFASLHESAIAASGDFDKAFEATEENSRELSNTLLFQQGKKTKAELEKLLGKAEKAKESRELSLENGQIEEKQGYLQQIILQQKEKAASELATAQEKQRQFGNADTLETLQGAQDKSDAGSAFTAWTIARNLNREFDAQTLDAKSEGGSWTNLLLGAAGGIALIALGVFFLRRKSVNSFD